jgi:N4-gp56 family major capsid protein
MAITAASNAFNPQVWADLIQASFLGQVRVLPHALQDDTLVGKPGDTVTFPKWNTLTDLTQLSEGVAMVPEAIDQTATKATIAEFGKAVEYTDTRDLVGLGDVETEVVRQYGILAARAVDTSLITVAAASTAADAPNKIAASAPLTYASPAGTGGTALTWPIITGAIAQFGDEWDPADFSGLFIRSDAQAKLFVDSQFTNAGALGASTPVARGQIGTIAGLPVIVTDRLATGKFMLLKRGAIGVLYKRRPIVEHDRDILKRTNVVTTNVHYAAKRLNEAHRT